MAMWSGGAQIEDTRIHIQPKEIQCPYCAAPGHNSYLMDTLMGTEWSKFLLECCCKNRYFVTKSADKSIAYEDSDPIPYIKGGYKSLLARKAEADKAEAELKTREAELLDLKAKLDAEREAMAKAEAEFDAKVAASLARIGKVKKGVI